MAEAVPSRIALVRRARQINRELTGPDKIELDVAALLPRQE